MKRICVFTGSSVGARSAYTAAALALAEELVARGIELVYGGGQVGLMGRLADAVLERGGHVIGVIPERLARKEVMHEGLPDLRVVGSMHERKALMAELACGFAALPGGIGTLEEIFEAWTWLQLDVQAKPVGLLDVDGYYGSLLAFLDRAVEERFLKPVHRALLLVDDDPATLLDRLAHFDARSIGKWIDR